ncbi:MAG: CoA pyrophosphatase [Pseudomonadota bacterium]
MGILTEAELRALTQSDAVPTSDFDLNEDAARPTGRTIRPAAVLIAVENLETGGNVILTKRSSRLKHHPGQIALPGGKVDPADDGPVDAALREASEEVGLPRTAVRVLGSFAPHETVTAFSVTPVLGLVTAPFDDRPEVGEVAEVFRVPLAHVLDPANFRVESRTWQGRQRYYYAVPYGPFYIWGATARIFRAIAAQVSK